MKILYRVKEYLRGAVGMGRTGKKNLMPYIPHKHIWTPSHDAYSSPSYWCYWCSKRVPEQFIKDKGHIENEKPFIDYL